ncbi:unnamed protein product [Brugia timori]|uniref:Transcriptional regulator n=1 Tax=Brugia timori TaxID=42155 RepID=A0A0R3R202_9BILA|nr:unnamed protein product [Brugia timori]
MLAQLSLNMQIEEEILSEYRNIVLHLSTFIRTN